VRPEYFIIANEDSTCYRWVCQTGTRIVEVGPWQPDLAVAEAQMRAAQAASVQAARRTVATVSRQSEAASQSAPDATSPAGPTRTGRLADWLTGRLSTLPVAQAAGGLGLGAVVGYLLF
jgi:hypothetical protein